MSFRSSPRGAVLGLLALLALAPALRAQTAGTPTVVATERVCPVVADTSRFIPTRQQTREREQMRDSLLAVARRHRVAGPRGLLFTSVDSTRRGRVLFLDTNLPAPAVQQATRQMEEYLHTLQPGRDYQMLVRIEGDEPVMAAGKRHCPPSLLNAGEVQSELWERLSQRPPSTRPDPKTVQRAVVRLVVNREGGVSYVDVDRPSGDPLLDELLPEYGRKLRFDPATLDGVPFDVRIRYRF